MDFTFGLKDLIYISINVVTITTVIVSLRNRIKNLEALTKMFKSILFKNDGTLNMVTVTDYKEHQKENTEVNNKMLSRLEKMSNNVIRIGIHMKVDLED